ncbi:hypothetical protein C4577_02245 [Candidatus Parcubacteria bacterium]|nr:MAG: hypothetical protein C4577_02245 [Candidatus Parcubacteria bacterium]
MSAKGIKIAADALAYLQNARHQLFQLGSKDPESLKSQSGHQDILLGQLLDNMKDFGKDKFSKLVMMDIETIS